MQPSWCPVCCAVRQSPRQLSNVEGQVELLPFGGSNVVASQDISALLLGTEGGVEVTALTGVEVVPLCGNGVCELGERPSPSSGVVGCAADCPFPTANCPYYNGLVSVCACACVCACVQLILPG